MDKKKVLFITPSLCQGGREHSLITMLKLLDKTKYDITLFTYRDDMTLLPFVPKEVRVVTDKNKPHYHRNLKVVFNKSVIVFSKILKLKQLEIKTSEKLKSYIHDKKVKHPTKDIFKNEKFDVVISNAEGFCTEIAICIEADKHFMFFHNSVDTHYELHQRIFPLYDKIIAVCDGVKDMLMNSYPSIIDKIMVLDNYVDAQCVVQKSKEIIDIEFRDKLKLCTCGRASKEKGFDLAIKAANILKQKGIDFVWYFVSDGEQMHNMKVLIEKYSLDNDIIITGYLENPFPYYKDCDIYVQPSYHESFGLTMKEAIILGKPVVSTDTVGGNKILEGGKYGEIVQVSPLGIAEGILNAVDKSKSGSYYKYDITMNVREKLAYINKLDCLLQS